MREVEKEDTSINIVSMAHYQVVLTTTLLFLDKLGTCRVTTDVAPPYDGHTVYEHRVWGVI